MSSIVDRKTREKSAEGLNGDRGFTFIELLIGMTILMLGLVSVAAMFPMGVVVVSDAGKMTMTLTGTRQIIEDIRSLPFDNVMNLNGFDTTDPATLPANQPMRDIARRWRYALARDGQGFAFTTDERAQWGSLSTTSAGFGARGRIAVVADSATLRRVTVTITVPGRRPTNITMGTIITRM